MTDAEKVVPKKPRRSVSPKELVDAQKEEFAKRLYRAMVGKGWTNAELARRANLERNTITTYMNRRSLPSASNMHALAEVLDLTVEDLLPDYNDLAIEKKTTARPPVRFHVSEQNDRVGFLEVNRWVSTSTALKIQELLHQDRVRDENDEPAD